MDWIDLEVPLWQGSFERAEVCLCYCWRFQEVPGQQSQGESVLNEEEAVTEANTVLQPSYKLDVYCAIAIKSSKKNFNQGSAVVETQAILTAVVVVHLCDQRPHMRLQSVLTTHHGCAPLEQITAFSPQQPPVTE